MSRGIRAVAGEAGIEDRLGDADLGTGGSTWRRIWRRGKEPRRDAAEAVRLVSERAQPDLAAFEPLRKLVPRLGREARMVGRIARRIEPGEGEDTAVHERDVEIRLDLGD